MATETNHTEKIIINLEKDSFRIIEETSYEELFTLLDDGTKRFSIEGDSDGCSCVEMKDNTFYYVNYLYERDSMTPGLISNRKIVDKYNIDRKKAIELIKEGLAIHYLGMAY